ncbi:hypothetical protein FOA52_005708 [Chlamydomonas sp. UWO 241]|nr:hypothetical protein FOA52_005708 [Chlamydomonas sp. UWO 241]
MDQVPSATSRAHGPGAKRNFPGEAISELPETVGTKRNFPGETISELPETVGEGRKLGRSSRFLGVSWHKASSAWCVKLWEPQTKRLRHIGHFACEEDAARAYDCAAVQAHGPGTKRNFPGEAISFD